MSVLISVRDWAVHVSRAFGWSMSGLAFLFRTEVAARVELVAALVSFAWLVLLRRTWVELGVFVLLCLVTLAMEALNTAVEMIVDHLSPQRSEFAGRAKDLGSAAVFLMLAGDGLYVLALSVATAVGR